jgi:protein-disulfide isomerase
MSTAQRQRAADKADLRRARAAAAMAEQQAAERRRKVRRGLLAGALAVALLAVLAVAVQTSRSAGQSTGATPPSATVEGAFLVGQDTAPVTVTIYADFLCPACQRFEQSAGPMLDGWVEEGTVQVAYHPISILDRASTTRYSTRSAAASAAAAEAGHFREFATALYDQQPAEGGKGLSDGELVEIGRSVGIDDPAFEDAVRDRRYTGWVGRATDLATEAGVTGTPTVLVDGQPLADNDPATLQAAVEAASG